MSVRVIFLIKNLFELKMKDRNLIETEREAQTIFYSLTAEYEKMLNPFFEILDKNKTLETI